MRREKGVGGGGGLEKQTSRQAERMRDKQTDKETDRHTDREEENHCPTTSFP